MVGRIFYRNDTLSNASNLLPTIKEIITISDFAKHAVMTGGELRIISQFLEKDQGIEIRDFDGMFSRTILGKNALDFSSTINKFDTGASGDYSMSIGMDTKSPGVGSFSQGEGSISFGRTSTSMGLGTISNNNAQFVCGKYNIGNLDSLFEVGGGIDENNRTNIFEIKENGLALIPLSTFDKLKVGGGSSVVNINYLYEKERNVLSETQSGVIYDLNIDFSDRVINRRLDVNGDVNINMPKNGIPGQTGTIEFWSQNINPTNISFSQNWFNVTNNSYSANVISLSNYSKLTIRYRFLDENNIEYEELSKYTPHLPIQPDVTTGFLNNILVNQNGDYLIS